MTDLSEPPAEYREGESPPPPPPPLAAETTPPPKRGRGRPRKDADPVAPAAGSTENKKPGGILHIHRKRPARAVKVPQVTAAEAEKMAEEIAGELALSGLVLATIAPVTGITIAQNAEAVSTATLELAMTNPRLMRFVLATLRGAKYAVLAQFGAAIIVGVGVDTGLISPDALPAEKLCGPAIAHVRAAMAEAGKQAETAA